MKPLIKEFKMNGRPKPGCIKVTVKDGFEDRNINLLLIEETLTDAAIYANSTGSTGKHPKIADVNKFIFTHKLIKKLFSPSQLPLKQLGLVRELNKMVHIEYSFECACCDSMVEHNISSWTKLRDFYIELIKNEDIDGLDGTASVDGSQLIAILGVNTNMYINFLNKKSTIQEAFKKIYEGEEDDFFLNILSHMFEENQVEHGVCPDCFTEIDALIADYKCTIDTVKSAEAEELTSKEGEQEENENVILRSCGYVDNADYQYLYARSIPCNADQNIATIVTHAMKRGFDLYGAPLMDNGHVFQAMKRTSNYGGKSQQ